MDNTKPYLGLSADRLTALINKANNSDRKLGIDFTFGVPASYSDSAQRNTQVTMIRVPGTNYKADQNIHYTRLALTVLDQLPPGWVKSVEIDAVPFSIHQILDQINAALGLNLAVDEVQDVQYETEAESYALPVVEANSLAWINSDYAFKAHFAGADLDLSQVIFDTDLEDGLVYLQPEERA